MKSARPSCCIRRGAVLGAGLLCLGAGLLWAQSDTAETPPGEGAGSGGWPKPLLAPSTNAASMSFMEEHPALQHSLPPPSVEQAPPADVNGGTDNIQNRLALSQGLPDELPAHLLVVYNANDPDSGPLAQYYADKRNIPAERVLALSCPTTEEISRDDYDTTIRQPITSYLYKKNWMSRRSVPIRAGRGFLNLLMADRNDIWAIVLMRGVPLKIANDPNVHGSMENFGRLQTNAAAVDSELALLPIYGLPLGGFAPNVFFDPTGSGLVRAGPQLATKIILVTRLDGPRPADVRRMIDDTLYAEENRLAGLAVIDTRGLADNASEYSSGDIWLRHSRDALANAGWTVRCDENASTIPETDPLDHVGIYLGWYHGHANGPWVTPPNRLVRGSIAYHLHSFSASTVRSSTQNWVGPLITHGAAATMGCVYEPYLDLTPHLDIFTKRLLQGDSFAEAAYASQKALSWMVTVVGDPLYQPFKQPLDAIIADSGPASSDHYDWLLLQQVRRGLISGNIPNTTESLVHYLDIPGAVAQEGLGDLLDRLIDPTARMAEAHAYQEALNLASQPVDHIRIGLKLAQLDRVQGNESAADTELANLRNIYPGDAARFGVPAPALVAGTSPAPAVMSPEDYLHPPKPPKAPSPVSNYNPDSTP